MTTPEPDLICDDGLIVRLTAAEAMVPRSAYRQLFAQCSVPATEIRTDRPYAIWQRACREFERYQNRYGKRGQQLIIDALGRDEYDNPVVEVVLHSINGETLENRYETGVARFTLTSWYDDDSIVDVDVETDDANTLYTIIGSNKGGNLDHTLMLHKLRLIWEAEWNHVRVDVWRHTISRTVAGLMGTVPMGRGLFWTPAQNRAMLDNIKTLLKGFEEYQTCPLTGRDLSPFKPSLLVWRYSQGDAEGQHEMVGNSIAENITKTIERATKAAARAYKRARNADSEGKIETAHIRKYQKELERVSAWVQEVELAIGGPLSQARAAKDMMEAAQKQILHGYGKTLEKRIEEA